MSVAERFSIVPWPSSQLAACHHIQLVSVNQLLENEQAVLDTTGFFVDHVNDDYDDDGDGDDGDDDDDGKVDGGSMSLTSSGLSES